MFRGMGIVAALLFAGGYFAGAFGPSSYSRTVSRPPAEVMAALRTLDITAQPGAPGSTAAAAGGIKPLFRLAAAGDRMTWYVMSGDKVATAMTAQLDPVDGGKATRIRTSVERGDAPDDFVSPAFRSKGLTMALFGAAIEGRVNRLVAPAAGSEDDCERRLQRFTDDNYAAGTPARATNFTAAMGEGARNIMRLHAMEAEMRRNGCNTNDDGNFRTMEERMGPSGSSVKAASANNRLAGSYGGYDRSGAAHTAADRPMLDPTPAR